MAKHQFDKLYEKYSKTNNPYNLNSKNIETFLNTSNPFKNDKIIEHGLLDMLNPSANNTNSTSSFENNTKVNAELLDKSTAKLFSNITSKVIQNNTTSTAAAVGSANTIWINGVKCRNIVISDVDQTSSAQASVTSQSRQQSTSNVSSEITNTISKTISSSGSNSLENIDKYDAPNIKKLKSYMSGNPSFDLAGALSFGSINPNENATINSSMKTALNLDQGFTVKAEQEVTTNISNSISQTNLATCKASASAQNQLILSDIACNNFTMDKIKQKAFSELVMNCVFDQKNTSNITTQITNALKSQYNQVYKNAGRNCGETKSEDKGSFCSNPDLLDTWAAASVEKLALVAGVLPEAKLPPEPIRAEIIPETIPETIPEAKPVMKQEAKPEIKPEIKPEVAAPPPPPPPPSNALTNEQLLLIGGSVIFILLLLVSRR